MPRCTTCVKSSRTCMVQFARPLSINTSVLVSSSWPACTVKKTQLLPPSGGQTWIQARHCGILVAAPLDADISAACRCIFQPLFFLLTTGQLCGTSAFLRGVFQKPFRLPPSLLKESRSFRRLLLPFSHYSLLDRLSVLSEPLSSEPCVNQLHPEVSWPALWGTNMSQIPVRIIQMWVNLWQLFQCIPSFKAHLRMLSILSARLFVYFFGESSWGLCRKHMMVNTLWMARLTLTLRFFTLMFYWHCCG